MMLEGKGMRKILLIITIIILGCCGYLYYDWHVKTKKQAAEPSISQYAWTDPQGIKHFTDSPPPKGATNIKKIKGYKYIEPPLVVTLKKIVVESYGKITEKLFKPKKKKKKGRKE
jgi:hypothetical protein